MNEAPFISLPIYTAATTVSPPSPPPMSATITTSQTTTTAVTGGSKSNKSPQPSLPVSPNFICFRILCHDSRIGGVIGKSGSIIKQLQQETSAKIRVENALPDSDDRVISVVADSSVNRTMSFDEESSQENIVESREYVQVSAAQEALIRVYDRILHVAAETDYGCFPPGGVVSCRLLVDTSFIGGVIGRGGKVVKKIRKDTGCRVKIFGQERLPSCAMPTDEMVEIQGDVLAIKKALVTIAGILQDSSPDKPRMVYGRPQNGFNQETRLPNGHMEYPLSRTLVQEPASTSSANYHYNGRFFGSLKAEIPPLMDYGNSHQIVFRILCSSDRIGGVIGNSGTIVRALEIESGASISTQAPVPNCDERLITISAIESPESQNSPAQNAVIVVFNRSVEVGNERGLDLPSPRALISARLLIPHHQMGCLLGKNGSIIEDMRKVTGAFIKIVGGNQVPRCASETDQVVLMTGEFVNVQDALYSVTGRLRKHIFSSRLLSVPKIKGAYGQGNGQPPHRLYSSSVNPHSFDQHTNLTQSMDNLRLFNNGDHHPSSSGHSGPCQYQDVDKGSTSVKGGIELGRGGRSAIITNTTVEILVPENVIKSVYGENGSNLTRLRQISGAKVVVREPDSGTTDHTVIISGTPNETQSAQSLLQAFILADQQ